MGCAAIIGLGWVAVDLPPAEQPDDPVRDLVGTLAATMMQDQLTRFTQGDGCQSVGKPASLDRGEDRKTADHADMGFWHDCSSELCRYLIWLEVIYGSELYSPVTVMSDVAMNKGQKPTQGYAPLANAYSMINDLG